MENDPEEEQQVVVKRKGIRRTVVEEFPEPDSDSESDSDDSENVYEESDVEEDVKADDVDSDDDTGIKLLADYDNLDDADEGLDYYEEDDFINDSDDEEENFIDDDEEVPNRVNPLFTIIDDFRDLPFSKLALLHELIGYDVKVLEGLKEQADIIERTLQTKKKGATKKVQARGNPAPKSKANAKVPVMLANTKGPAALKSIRNRPVAALTVKKPVVVVKKGKTVVEKPVKKHTKAEIDRWIQTVLATSFTPSEQSNIYAKTVENAINTAAKEKGTILEPYLRKLAPKYIDSGKDFFESEQGLKLSQSISRILLDVPNFVVSTDKGQGYITGMYKKIIGLYLDKKYLDEKTTNPEIKEAMEEWKKMTPPNSTAITLAFVHLSVKAEFYTAKYTEALTTISNQFKKAEGRDVFPSLDDYRIGSTKPTMKVIEALFN